MRLICFLIGISLFGVIIWLGFYTNSNPSFGIWFGVITTLVSPFAFELLMYTFRAKEKHLLRQLSKVPQIDQLINEAKDNEEKIRILEKQKAALDDLIAFEAKRKSLGAERQMYVHQGKEALNGIQSVNHKLRLLMKEEQNFPVELRQLANEVFGDDRESLKFTVGGKIYILKKSFFDFFPFYGGVFFELFKGIRDSSRDLDKKMNSDN